MVAFVRFPASHPQQAILPRSVKAQNGDSRRYFGNSSNIWRARLAVSVVSQQVTYPVQAKAGVITKSSFVKDA